MIVCFLRLFLFQVWRIWFEKSGGDLGPSAGLPRSHGVKSNASRGAPTSDPSLPCFFESASGGNQIRHTVTSGFAPRYTRYIADTEINCFIFIEKISPREIHGGKISRLGQDTIDAYKTDVGQKP